MRWFYCYYAQILSRHPALPHVYRLSRHKNKKYLCTSASSSFPPQKYPGISASSFVCLTCRLTCGPWSWPPPPAVVRYRSSFRSNPDSTMHKWNHSPSGCTHGTPKYKSPPKYKARYNTQYICLVRHRQSQLENTTLAWVG